MIIKNGRWSKQHLVKAVEYADKTRDKIHHLSDIYEFGTYRGESLMLLEYLFYAYQLGIRKSFGLDSFKGLPAEAENVEKFHVFTQGAFADVEFLYPIKGQYIKCWFSDLETGHVAKLDLRPAKLVHIDCDLYISAYQALDFLFAHNLIQVGTVLCYDEFKSTSTLTAGGESKAHLEISDKYKVSSTEFFRNEYVDQIECWQNCFMINSIGKESTTVLLEE